MGKSAGVSGRKIKNVKPCSTVKPRKRKHSEISGTTGGSERKARKKRHTSEDSSPTKHGKGKIGKKKR